MTTANILITVLLGVNTALLAIVAGFLRRFIDNNEKDHEEFYTRTNALKERLGIIEHDHVRNHG